jgi:hypothetical protein
MGKKLSSRMIFLVVVVFVVAFVIIMYIISVKTNVMKPIEVPSNFIGAISGALIGALITFILLKGQTNLEEEKRKDIRVLEMKTKIFKDFINSVWKVWEGQIITIEKFEELTRQYYQNLMIFLKDESKLEVIGKALTEIGCKIDKTTYEDSKELRKNIVTVINTLSEDIGLGGKIDTKIMDKHDEIVFPIRLKKELLNKLNEKLGVNDNNSLFKGGKYESIWEGKFCEFITFELKEYPGIKLAIGIGAQAPIPIHMVFMADPVIQQIDKFRDKSSGNRYWRRFGQVEKVSDPIRDDDYDEEDKTTTPELNFSKEESMKKFREEKRNFPDILSKRVSYYLEKWKKEKRWEIEGLGYIEFFEKYLKK